jgi:hypothetical protein
MPILTQKALVLAKVETTSGTDAVPTATTDAFLCVDPVFTVESSNLERNFARPDFSTYASRIGKKLAQVSFSLQVAGGGVAGTEPIWAVLFRGCAMARSTLTVPNRIRFAPLTTAQETLTLYVYYEGLLHRITGAMGTWSLEAEAGNYAVINFTFTGLYNTPQDSTYPASVTVEDVVPPQVESCALTYGGDADLIVNALKMDIDNKVVSRPDLNSPNGYKCTRISGRDPKGGFDPEVEEDSPFWTQLEASTLSALVCNIGSVAGNKMTVSAPKAQIVGVSYNDRDNLRAFDLSLMFRRNAGDDELTIDFE